VYTAGPQWPDRIPENMPIRISEDISNKMQDRIPENISNRISEDIPDKMS
jgi:hypothetical protein